MSKNLVWKFSSLLVVAGVLYASACRSAETCTGDEECKARGAQMYCDRTYGICVVPDGEARTDAAGFEMPAPDAGSEKKDAGVDAGPPCHRDDAGMCLPQQWVKFELERSYSAPEAVRLPSGAILVVGSDPDFQSRNAELVETDDGQLTRLPNTLRPRSHGTAILLPSGNVLLAGGYHLGMEVSAERYLFEAKRWEPTSAMAHFRIEHAAALLPDGRVLLSGGFEGGGGSGYIELRTAEIYNEANDRWSPTTSMRFARSGHTLTALKDGRILAIGGAGAETELYDPSQHEWSTAKGQMKLSRQGHAATLLPSGDVLITGGSIADGGVTKTSELFDPVSETFASTADMQVARVDHAAVLLPSGDVLIVGGAAYVPGVGVPVDLPQTSEIFMASKGIWKDGPSPKISRRRPAVAVQPSGAVLLVGGGDGTNSDADYSFEILK